MEKELGNLFFFVGGKNKTKTFSLRPWEEALWNSKLNIIQLVFTHSWDPNHQNFVITKYFFNQILFPFFFNSSKPVLTEDIFVDWPIRSSFSQQKVTIKSWYLVKKIFGDPWKFWWFGSHEWVIYYYLLQLSCSRHQTTKFPNSESPIFTTKFLFWFF